MPLSDASHAKSYKEPLDLHQKLQDIVQLLESLLTLDVNLPMKKRMLNHAIWEVTTASGNYKLRYRSIGVIKGIGVDIQRDHVFQKKTLAKWLLQRPHEVEKVVQSALSCVVTEAEHDKLTQYSREHPEVDGWARYQNSGITVYDMSTGDRVNYDNSAA